MEYYKESIETVVKAFNINLKDGLDESKIKQARHQHNSNQYLPFPFLKPNFEETFNKTYWHQAQS